MEYMLSARTNIWHYFQIEQVEKEETSGEKEKNDDLHPETTWRISAPTMLLSQDKIHQHSTQRITWKCYRPENVKIRLFTHLRSRPLPPSALPQTVRSSAHGLAGAKLVLRPSLGW